MAIPDNPAWLEMPNGERVPIKRTCTLGRSSSNDVAVKDEKVSRKHALIHTQEENEYWLVDFGSANGTSINGRRITQPTRLQDGDELELAETRLQFHQEGGKPSQKSGRPTSRSTSFETKTAVCWLLLADIVSSTSLSQNHPDKDLPAMLGKWFLECKLVIDGNAGTINKFLGDGFFAYWLDEKNAGAKVAKAMEQLGQAQQAKSPQFRLALHHGEVSLGGTPLMVEELFGRTVNFVFRMEKLGGKLGVDRLLSTEARGNLPGAANATPLGPHALPGFHGEFSFFSF
jgi:pSer/pThr/pTyr-binding forkhead associated (FHA) protein